MKRPDRRYAAWGGGMVAVAALPLLGGFTSLGWELSEWVGLVGALGCVALCGCPVRPRQATPPVLLSVSRHEALGWMVFGAATLHGLVAIAADHTVLEYLKTTAPLYQMAGWAAMAVLALLVLSGAGAVRRRLWRSHRTFQATHIIAGCLLLVLLGAHVAATGRYAGGYAGRLLFVATGGAAITMLLRRRRTGKAPSESSLQRRGVFGRHSQLLVSVIACSVVGLGLLIPGRAVLALRESAVPRGQTLPLNFDHRFHTTVNCLVCHHNYADGKGFEACIACHRSARTDLKAGAEARFHGFCLDCHRSPLRLLAKHGPESGCVVCHQPPRN